MSEAAGTSLSKETLGGTVAQFSMALIGFVGTIVFARWLGPSAFGGVYLLFALVKFADRPMNGWSLAAKKRVAESDALRPPRSARNSCSTPDGSSSRVRSSSSRVTSFVTTRASRWPRCCSSVCSPPNRCTRR
ncbi:hypothetical protein [Haladaptatus sp. W1]|uniref:hypothetical protein n=1 Tax=Haladaptatus sp. W1 TaxID=1897478 RepID=UPI000A91D58F|nr:hypothetical protein [Haladaptatus sp. W1]